MKYSHYLTITDPGTQSNEVYSIPYPKIEDELTPGQLSSKLDFYCMVTFSNYVNIEMINNVIGYLDFHFIKHNERNPNDEMMFLYFVEESITDSNIIEGRQNILKHWIETKRKELETPRGNQANCKTYITHPQQVLLFNELGIIKFLTDKYKLGKEQTAEIISLLANRGKDNTGDYIRYIEQPKEKTAKSKQNMNPKTPENIEFVNQIMNKITPPV